MNSLLLWIKKLGENCVILVVWINNLVWIFFPILGYLESFIGTKDICVFTSTAAEAEFIGKLLDANCYFALVAHNFLPKHELDNIERQWNTPHTTDAMPVLGMLQVLSDVTIQ